MVDKNNIIKNITSEKADTSMEIAQNLKDSIQVEVEVSSETIHYTLKKAGMKAIITPQKTASPTKIFINIWNLLYNMNTEL